MTAYGRDFEVIQRLRPEPMTAEEEAAQDGIEAVDFEIFRHKLEMIAQEGKETTMKLGASTGMRWGDVAFGVYTAQGDLSVVATGIWFHAVLGEIPVKFMVKHWLDEPSVGIREGDSFFWNDPFYGGTHGADMGLAIPVFYEGKLVCFVGALNHTGENGGTDPGGLSANARSRYDDGLLAPPIKVGEGYALREDLLTVLASMTRDPRTLILDVKARLAACRIAQRRLLEVIEEKGPEFVIGGLRRVLSVTAEAARKKVSLLNDGVFEQPRFLDTVGTEAGLVRIGLRVEKRGDTIRLSFAGSSPQVQGKPLNTFFQGIVGLTMVYFCGWFFHDLPANNGLLEVLEWDFPEGTLVNCDPEASTSLAPFPQTCYVTGMFTIGARMSYHLDPERAEAAWYTGFGVPMYGGLNQFGEPVADTFAETNGTGAGGRVDLDGVDCAGAFFATMSDAGDVEATEADRPFLYLHRNFLTSSYGHGKHRGGAGIGLAVMIAHVPGMVMGGFGYGAKFPAATGVFGGYAAPTMFLRTVRGSNMRALLAGGDRSLPRTLDEVFAPDNPERGDVELRHISMAVEPFAEGDTFYNPVGGGAGYGDALERDPEAVLADLRIGLVTPWAARNVYRVAYDEETLDLDSARTDAWRLAAREGRKTRGRPYDEFAAEWGAERPPADVLAYYGTYPDPGVSLTAAGAVAAGEAA